MASSEAGQRPAVSRTEWACGHSRAWCEHPCKYLSCPSALFHPRSQCINQMKELKEQCEEQIEEVTKKGNEAVASRDLSEKDQSQQVILDLFCQGFPEGAPPSLHTSHSLICCVICSNVRSPVWVWLPETTAWPRMLGICVRAPASRASLGAQAFTGIPSVQAHGHPGGELPVA